MLSGLVLENFKAFSGRRSIPIAPLTLVFGENSAGKSSILQALLLLKQTALRLETDGAPLLARGNLVDLASFENFVFEHDSRLVCEIAPVFNLKDWRRSNDEREHGNVDAYHLSSLARVSDAEPFLAGMGVRTRLNPSSRILELDALRFYFGDLAEAAFVWSAGPDVATSAPLSITGRGTGERWLPEFPLAHYLDNVEINEHNVVWRNLLEQIRGTLSGGFAESNASFDEVMNDTRHLSNDVKMVLRNLHLDLAKGWVRKESLNSNGEPAYLDGRLPDLSGIAVQVSGVLRRAMERIRYIGPLREPPERWSVFGGVAVDDVGRSGQALPDLLYSRQELIAEINDTLRRFEIGYELDPQWLHDASGGRSDVFSLQLRGLPPHRPGARVSIRDVGFGVGQMLPVIVQSMMSQDDILLIEQPELHLHPRLQAELGDLFIRSALGGGRNTFLLETHSEHLILRIMRRIRETAQESPQNDLPAVYPDDVAILYVKSTENGSLIWRLKLDEEGQLIDPWPGGFFEERFHERFS